MKALVIGLALSLLVVIPLGCGKKDKGDNKNEEKGALDSFTDYATGKTQIEAGQAAKRKLIGISIQEAVDYFSVQEGREPTSLQDLVDAGNLASEYTKDEYGRPLQSSVKDGKLVVRSVKADGTVSWEKAF
jgi:competence protein ComGC